MQWKTAIAVFICCLVLTKSNITSCILFYCIMLQFQLLVEYAISKKISKSGTSMCDNISF